MTGRGARPGYLRWSSIGLVVLGGAFGAAAREGVVLAIPDLHEVPVAILVVNVVGAFVLGCLTEVVLRRLPDDPRGPRLRLLLGTGFCGGFTTYSTLATDVALLLDSSRAGLGVAYALTTVLVGAGATLAGIVVAARYDARSRRVDCRTVR
ncbi:fluoride efflux transporter FluC [Oerskovia sp. NPDC060338]|uniref:fluoride efflux transporter FluC n=1 Tax=Oerskovia sp. NPDC060338 TaxID=3347100 RepID=UPI00365F2297